MRKAFSWKELFMEEAYKWKVRIENMQKIQIGVHSIKFDEEKRMDATDIKDCVEYSTAIIQTVCK
ncbi:MAG: hypothetical protein J6K58_06835 [Lachnospiraceae bacterium]|nr:hypothetical protein [Lachnospiraceae bacterium]MBP3458907.1 hypothetical protein [Lachnospiraceae bacterium]